MGVVSVGTQASGDQETLFSSRARITFRATGETDNGLSFGATLRAEQAAIAENGAANAGGTAMIEGTVFVRGAFGTLTMGDITAALDAATGDLHAVGYTGLTGTDFNYISGTDTGLAYSYSIEGLTVGISMSQRATNSADETNAFGVSYKFGDYTVAAGYAEKGINEQSSLAFRGAVQGVNFAVVYVDNKKVTGTGAATIDNEIGASIAYTMDALTLTAFSRTVNYFAAGTKDDVYTGIGASYNLGGGARLVAGFSDGGGETNKDNAWDLGMTFSF
jgi:outer membrane protein OmpU